MPDTPWQIITTPSTQIGQGYGIPVVATAFDINFIIAGQGVVLGMNEAEVQAYAHELCARGIFCAAPTVLKYYKTIIESAYAATKRGT